MQFSYTLIAAVVGFASAAPSAVEKRDSYQNQQLYVYPSDSNGKDYIKNLKVISNGEKVLIGDYTLLKDDEYANVLFSLDAWGSKLVINPDTTGRENNPPSWSNRVLVQPGNSGKGTDYLAIGPDDDVSGYLYQWIDYEALLFPTGNTVLILPYAEKTDIDGVYAAKTSFTSPLPDDKPVIGFTTKTIG